MSARNVAYGDTLLFLDFTDGGYITCRKRKGVSVMMEKLQTGLRQPPEVKDCLFRVLPKLQYSAYNRYVKAARNVEAIRPQDRSSTVQKDLEKKEELRRQESQSNLHLIHKMQGTPVQFGELLVVR